MEGQQQRVGLTDAVKAVQSELLAAIEDAGSEEVRFALRSVELEFEIDFRPAADGSVQVLVLSAGVDESAQPVRIHRLRVTLDPPQRRPWSREPLGPPVRPPADPGYPGIRPSQPPPRPSPPSAPPAPGLGGDRPGDRFRGF
jgi:hypothetical protein